MGGCGLKAAGERYSTAGGGWFCCHCGVVRPARAGYGLFLPYFQDKFGFSIQTAGFVASRLQAGYLVALTAVGLLVARVGPRPMVLAGMLAAGLGMALVASATAIVWLAGGRRSRRYECGLVVGALQRCRAWVVSPRLEGRILSVISTGTTFGILGPG